MPEAITIVQSRAALRDPQDCTDQADDLALLEAAFEALVRRDAGGRYRPAAAESWSLSPDARRWTFRLRPGQTFHDGQPIDAETARFAIARMQRPEIGATLGAPAVWGQYLGDATIAATGPLTLEIETPKPTADLLDVLAPGYLLPPDLTDRPDFLAAPIGSGPYRIDAIAPGRIEMSPHPGRAESAAKPKLIWLEMPDPKDRLAAVRAGAAQIATRLAPDDDPGPAARLQAHVDPVSIIYLLNAASGPFRDARLRRAVNLALDRDALIASVLAGAGAPLRSYVSGGHFGADPAAPDLTDRAAAQALLRDAGCDGGLALTVDCPTRLPDEAVALTQAVAAQLAPFGIRLDIRYHDDRVAYAERVRAKAIGDMCVFDSSPMSVFRVLNEKIDSRWQGAWWQGYANAKVEALLDRGRRAVDERAREALYAAAFRALRDDPPWLYLYNRVRAAAFAPAAQGWTIRQDGVLAETAAQERFSR